MSASLITRARRRAGLIEQGNGSKRLGNVSYSPRRTESTVEAARVRFMKHRAYGRAKARCQELPSVVARITEAARRAEADGRSRESPRGKRRALAFGGIIQEVAFRPGNAQPGGAWHEQLRESSTNPARKG